MRSTATTLTSWTRAIRKALDAAGVDSAALFAQAGLDIAALADPQARFPATATRQLWKLAVQATGNPAFGLEAARHAGQTSFHALGYSLNASATLKEAFERLLRYFRVVTEIADLSLDAESSRYRLRIGTPADATAPADEAVDAFCSVVVRMCRGIYRRDYAPLRVQLQHAEPIDSSAYQRAFRAPVEFGADCNAIDFDVADFDRALEGANPELAQHNEEIAARYLARFAKPQLATRLQVWLVEQLPSGVPPQQKAAEHLHLSLRSLQRKLAEQGTSYKQLLDETRRGLALSYLRDARYSISELSYLLGFSDTSSFTHAFRRWTGSAPSRNLAEQR
jgi:AraC-like DNA-binding protein